MSHRVESAGVRLDVSGGAGALGGLALLVATLAAGCGSATAVRVQLQPPLALRDAPLVLSVSGLHPQQRVTIRAQERSARGRLWRSSLAVRAGAGGRVTVRRALLEGLMRPLGTASADDQFPAVRSTIRVSVLAGTRVLATSTAVRLLRPAGVRVEVVRPGASSIYGDYFIPAHGSNGVPVLFFGGSEGGLRTTAVASLLAAHGHPTLALAYFAEPGLPAALRDIPLEYFGRALDWLRRQPQVHGRRIVVAGGSYGGEAALLVGSAYPGLVDGVIALSPSDLVSTAPGDLSAAAWTLNGRPLAPGQPIAVEKIKGPIFAVAGGSDLLWASSTAALDIEHRLETHRPAPTILIYPGAGHSVVTMVPNIPTVTQAHTKYGLLSLGGTRTADERAREQAWPQMLSWLARLS
jgi:dienelactone hydrolase